MPTPVGCCIFWPKQRPRLLASGASDPRRAGGESLRQSLHFSCAVPVVRLAAILASSLRFICLLDPDFIELICIPAQDPVNLAIRIITPLHLISEKCPHEIRSKEFRDYGKSLFKFLYLGGSQLSKHIAANVPYWLVGAADADPQTLKAGAGMLND